MCYLNALFVFLVTLTIPISAAFAETPNAKGICIQRQELTARSQGIVEKVYVAEGQDVKKGDKIIEFDSRLLRTGVKEATAAVEATRANEELAADAYSRIQKLQAGESVTESQQVETRIRLAQARAARKQAEAVLERIKIQVDDTVIRAEVAGKVRGLPTAIGLAVQVGQSLGRIEAQSNSSCVPPTPKTN